MPYLETSGGSEKVKFQNLRGRHYNRFDVISMKAFDDADPANAFWKCRCECGREFKASTIEIESYKIIACERCMEEDAFLPEEILIVREATDKIKAGAEVIFKGPEPIGYRMVRVEYAGRILTISRDSLEPTGSTY